jgi:hypothetical protein
MYVFTGRAYDKDGAYEEDGDIINEISINVTGEDEGEAMEKIKLVVTRQHYEFLQAKELRIVD